MGMNGPPDAMGPPHDPDAMNDEQLNMGMMGPPMNDPDAMNDEQLNMGMTGPPDAMGPPHDPDAMNDEQLNMGMTGPPDKMNGMDMTGMSQGAQDAMMGLPAQTTTPMPDEMGTTGGR